MKSKELIKFIAETLRNIGVGFIISSIVLILSSDVKLLNLILLLLLGFYNIAGIYLFWFYVVEGE